MYQKLCINVQNSIKLCNLEGCPAQIMTKTASIEAAFYYQYVHLKAKIRLNILRQRNYMVMIKPEATNFQ